MNTCFILSIVTIQPVPLQQYPQMQTTRASLLVPMLRRCYILHTHQKVHLLKNKTTPSLLLLDIQLSALTHHDRSKKHHSSLDLSFFKRRKEEVRNLTQMDTKGLSSSDILHSKKGKNDTGHDFIMSIHCLKKLFPIGAYLVKRPIFPSSGEQTAVTCL